MSHGETVILILSSMAAGGVLAVAACVIGLVRYLQR